MSWKNYCFGWQQTLGGMVRDTSVVAMRLSPQRRSETDVIGGYISKRYCNAITPVYPTQENVLWLQSFMFLTKTSLADEMRAHSQYTIHLPLKRVKTVTVHHCLFFKVGTLPSQWTSSDISLKFLRSTNTHDLSIMLFFFQNSQH